MDAHQALCGFPFETRYPRGVPQNRADGQFVGEMHEISSFIASSLGGEDGRKASTTYDGLADVFQRIADGLRRAGSETGGRVDHGIDTQVPEVEALGQWAEKARIAGDHGSKP